MRQRQRSFTRAQVPDTGGSVVAGSRDPSSAGIPGSACQPFAWPEGVADGFARCDIENPGLTERFDDEDSFAVGAEQSFVDLFVAEPHLNQFGRLLQNRAEPQAMGFLAVRIAAVQTQCRSK